MEAILALASEYGVFAVGALIIVATWAYISWQQADRITIRETADAERDKAFTELSREMQSVNTRLYEEISKLQKAIIKQNDVIVGLKTNVTEQDDVISEQNKVIGKLKVSVSDQDSIIAKQNEVIRSLKKEIDSLRDIAQKLSTALKRQRSYNKQYRTKAQEVFQQQRERQKAQLKKIRHYEVKLAEYETKLAEYEAILKNCQDQINGSE